MEDILQDHSINVFLYTTTIDHDGATGGREQSSQDRHVVVLPAPLSMTDPCISLAFVLSLNSLSAVAEAIVAAGSI